MFQHIFKLSMCVLAISFGVEPALARENVPLRDIPLENLFVEVSEADSNFTIVDARMDETATAAVLFGLVGAAISSVAVASEDDEKADRLRETAESIDVAGVLLAGINATLGANERIDMAADKSEASHILVVELRNWGLLRRSQEDNDMRAFLNLTLKIFDENETLLWEKKRENAVGSFSAPLEEFTDEKFSEEIEALVRKTGQYVGYQIIYR